MTQAAQATWTPQRPPASARTLGRRAVACWMCVVALCWLWDHTDLIDGYWPPMWVFFSLSFWAAVILGTIANCCWLLTLRHGSSGSIPERVIVGLVSVIGGMTAFGLVVKSIPIPPTSITTTRLRILEHRVLKYAEQRGTVPSSLVDLPTPQTSDFLYRLEDGWHRPIIYVVNGDGTVTLTSYGRDGRPGGRGRSTDIVHHFAVPRDAQSH